MKKVTEKQIIENRIIEDVRFLNQKKIKSLEEIVKYFNSKYPARWYMTRKECDYLTKYIKGDLNFEAKIISIKI